MMTFLWTAFIVGLAGSFHCVGMCGPIALALPGGFSTRITLIGSRLLYNLGRVVTYTFLGALFGIIGQTFALAGFQQALSIGLGILLLAIALFSLDLESRFLSFLPVQQFTKWLKIGLGRFLKGKSYSSLFFIGLINGFLPCGFVYIGLFGAMASGSVMKGMFYMTFFGIGTIPLMLTTALFGTVISVKTRNLIKRSVPVFLVVFAALFILRGMNLGVPFLSPEIAKEEVSCH